MLSTNRDPNLRAAPYWDINSVADTFPVIQADLKKYESRRLIFINVFDANNLVVDIKTNKKIASLYTFVDEHVTKCITITLKSKTLPTVITLRFLTSPQLQGGTLPGNNINNSNNNSSSNNNNNNINNINNINGSVESNNNTPAGSVASLSSTISNISNNNNSVNNVSNNNNIVDGAGPGTVVPAVVDPSSMVAKQISALPNVAKKTNWAVATAKFVALDSMEVLVNSYIEQSLKSTNYFESTCFLSEMVRNLWESSIATLLKILTRKAPSNTNSPANPFGSPSLQAHSPAQQQKQQRIANSPSTISTTAQLHAVSNILSAGLQDGSSSDQPIPFTASYAERKDFTEFDNNIVTIDPFSFIRRVLRYNILQPENFIAGAILLERVRTNNRIVVSKKNIDALFVFACVLSTKFNDDKLMDNNTYAQCINMPKGFFNTLELSFLKLVDFDLYISPYEYYTYECNFLPAFISNNSHAFSQMALDSSARK